LSLGIETQGGVSTVLIERNTTVPVRKSEIFSTADNNQASVTIHVLQGERHMASDNRTLGNFTLDGIPPAPRGVPQIEVTFDINADGILNVSAKDKATNKEQDITIASSSGLSEEEIAGMVQDAKDNEQADRARKEEIEVANKLGTLVFQAEALVSSGAENLSDDLIQPLQAEVDKAKEALESRDVEACKSAIASLEAATHVVAKSMYESQASAPPENQSSSPDDDDNVIDAEYA